MIPINNNCRIFNYSDIFLNHFFHCETSYHEICPEHVLVMIYAGELIIHYGNNEITIKSGEYVFIQRDIDIIFIKKDTESELFRGVFMGFSSIFLSDFHKTIDKSKIPVISTKFESKVIRLPKTPYIQSLYMSLRPYFDAKIKPSKELLELKLQEGIYSLLLIDDKFYP